VADGGRVQLRCRECESYFLTTIRTRDTNCPKCNARRYVPARPEWEGPGMSAEKAEAQRESHLAECPRCGRIRRTTQREGTPTHCSGKLGCGASVRIRFVVPGDHPPAVGTTGARPPRPRKARAPRDVTPGSAAAIGRGNAASLRRERTAEQRAERATERAASEESLDAGTQGMSAIADSARQIAAMLGRQPPPSPAMATPTRVAAPKAPRRALSIGGIPVAKGDPYLCAWLSSTGRCNVGPVVLTIKGHGFCKLHKNGIELATS